MDVSEAKRLRELKLEKGKLKRVFRFYTAEGLSIRKT